MRRTLFGAVSAALLAISSIVAIPVTAAAAETGGYIVVLKEGRKDTVRPAELAVRYTREHGARTGFVYTTALQGFSAELSPAAVRALRADPAVAYVEPDGIGHADAQQLSTGVKRIFANTNPGLKVGDGIDERVDVDVAVLDTGVDYRHPDLNLVKRYDCQSGSCAENAGDDEKSHGSNVAGIVGAIDNDRDVVGVAPGARLWSYKVLNDDGNGNDSWVVAALDSVAANASEIEVVNMSLGFGPDVQSIKDATNRVIDKGVVVVASAGNSRKDVSSQTPANIPDVITVSSLSDSDGKPGGTGPDFKACNQGNNNVDDRLSDFSNFGPGVDLAAPGDCIVSTGKHGGLSNWSGTSQAAPQVAGAAAWLTSGGNRPADRAGVRAIRDTLVAQGNFAWTDTSGDNAKEPLLDLSDQNVFPPKPADPGAPSAKFTANCSSEEAKCSFDGSTSTDPDGSISSYSWDFGDGTTGTGANVSHTYSRAAYYSVSLTVTDNAGKTHKIRNQVKAGNLPPNASIAQNACIAQPQCTFDAGASNDPEGSTLVYSWDFGDGTTGSGVKATHGYPSKDAKYTVTLTVTDNRNQTGKATKVVDCKKLLSTVQCYSF